jgi:hypothetical protein
MLNTLDYPVAVLAFSLPTLWIAGWIGGSLRKKHGKLDENIHADFVFFLSSTLTLLGLIIGFTFSMAVNRYDQRKGYEEQEANAIGTEYARADLLPTADAVKVRSLLSSYLDQRILLYTSRDERQLRQINAQTTRLQDEMWSIVAKAAAAQPTPVASLILAGMNDVLNSEGYSQAARRNRIPLSAWTLLITLSIFCNLMMGYGAHRRDAFLFLVLPVALSISLFLIADIDSPSRGLIRVQPENLGSVVESLHSQ